MAEAIFQKLNFSRILRFTWVFVAVLTLMVGVSNVAWAQDAGADPTLTDVITSADTAIGSLTDLVDSFQDVLDGGATESFSDIAENIVETSEELPGLITALAYLLGLIFGISAIYKLKEHVENPTQTGLRVGVIRLIAGGALFALPIIYEAMALSIEGEDSFPLLSAIIDLIRSFLDFLSVLSGIGGNTVSDLNDIFENIIQSIRYMPGLVAALAYAFGLVLGVTGIVQLKEHVENPEQTPIQKPVVRFLVGGMLFALPVLFSAMANAIGGSSFGLGGDFGSISFTLSGLYLELGGLTQGAFSDINSILANFISSVDDLPALISGVAYMFGLVIGAMGILKIKEHVDNPDQVSIKEPVVRLLTAGALFSLTAIFKAMGSLIDGHQGFGFVGEIVSIFQAIGLIADLGTGSVCNPVGNILPINLGGIFQDQSTVGGIFCSFVTSASAVPAFLNMIAYFFGVVLGFWGILKIRDHALNPSQTPIWDGISRFIAGGAFFTLPVVVEAWRASLTPTGATATSFLSQVSGIFGFLGLGEGGFNETASACQGLDGALYCFMSDIYDPFHSILSFFALSAGIVLIMIGISRLMKSAQDGARGPGGIGTLMTFVAGAALISYNEIVRAFTGSMFADAGMFNYASLQYTNGISSDELSHAHTVISAVLKFMIIVGFVSFIRGIFIMRGVAEGDQQASFMAAATHLVGGALAVNLGSLMNAVQATLNITCYGVVFTPGQAENLSCAIGL